MPLEVSRHIVAADILDGTAIGRPGAGYFDIPGPFPADALLLGVVAVVTAPFPATTLFFVGNSTVFVDAISERTYGLGADTHDFATDPTLRVMVSTSAVADQGYPFVGGAADLTILYTTLSGLDIPDPGSGYCTLDDVKREMGKYGPNLTGASHPSEADAIALISSVAREIDGTLAAKGIAVPVMVPPNPVSVLPWIGGFLSRLNALGAAGAVLQGMFPHAQGPASSNLGPDKTAEYRAILRQMQKDETLIPNAILLDSTLAAPGSGRSLWTDGSVDTDPLSRIDPEEGPIFTRVTQW